MRGDIDLLRATAADTPGLELHVAGPAAALTDLTEVFGEVDGVLLAVALGAVLLILVLAYRSPVLPFVVLGVGVPRWGWPTASRTCSPSRAC